MPTFEHPARTAASTSTAMSRPARSARPQSVRAGPLSQLQCSDRGSQLGCLSALWPAADPDAARRAGCGHNRRPCRHRRQPPRNARVARRRCRPALASAPRVERSPRPRTRPDLRAGGGRAAVAAEASPGARSLPQLVHLARPTGAPQLEQNFSDPTGLPQLVQTVVRVDVSPLNCVVVASLRASG